jgi:hypothetical protein
MPDIKKTLHRRDVLQLHPIEAEIFLLSGYRDRAHIMEKATRIRTVQFGAKLLLWDTQFSKAPGLVNLVQEYPARQKELVERLMENLDEDWFAEKAPWLNEVESIPGMVMRIDFYPIRGLLEDLRHRIAPDANQRG